MSSALPSAAHAEHDQSVSLAVSPRPTPGNLPTPLTSLVGRERDLATILAVMRQPDVRLMTLTGPGGVGKTRLALAAAAALLAEYPDGVWFVPLAAIVNPVLVPAAITRALDVRPAPGRPLLDAIIDHLAQRRVLLVLDNLEQVLGAGPAIVTLLAGCRDLHVLATSRARLRLTGEHEHVVPPLSVSEAMRLFVERGRAVQPGFAITAENDEILDQICRRLDGLPLAIELAAARTKLLSPSALLARLTDRFQVLAGGPRDAPDRLQTMHRAVAWSYDLLTPGEQALFRRLAVFAGGCTLEGAQAVWEQVPLGCSAGEVVSSCAPSAPSVLDGVIALLDHTLVQRQDQPDGEPRLVMLETIRAFGKEQLVAAGEAEAIRRRHAECFLALVEEAAAKLQGPHKAVWLDRLELELDNLRTVLAWAIEGRDAAIALRLAGGLGQFWLSRGRIDEGADWLERALAGDDPARSVGATARGVCLRWLGLIDRTREDLARAERHMREALALFREVGDQRLIVRGLVGLGMIASDRSDVAREEALLSEALPIARAAGDLHGEAVVLQNLCTVRWSHGDVAAAAALNEAALARFREIDDPFSVGIASINGGMLAAGLGDAQRAAAHFADALATYRALGDPVHVSATLVRIGGLARQQGDLARAATAYREALELERDHGSALETVDTLLLLMRIAAVRGEAELAARLVGAAEARGDWRARRGAGTAVAAHDEAIAGLRSNLGSAGYDAAWAAGRALSLDQIVAEVRRLEVDPTATARHAAERLGLSPRELEVVQLLSEGLTDRQIAERLFIARKTASNHVAAILAKLGLESRSAVGAFALRRGLVSSATPAATAPASRA